MNDNRIEALVGLLDIIVLSLHSADLDIVVFRAQSADSAGYGFHVGEGLRLGAANCLEISKLQDDPDQRVRLNPELVVSFQLRASSSSVIVQPIRAGSVD